jgi:tRNA threonylcarbamoyladenosine biosynthesis protein TsaE
MACSLTRITCSPEATRAFGRTIGRHISTPLVVMMYGNLGSGKTVLVQGLAEGLSVPEDYVVTSPSYTLVNAYPGRMTLLHVDLYRLSGAGDIEDIGLDEMLTGDDVVAIEWSERLDEGHFGDRLCIHMAALDDTSRRLVLTAYGRAADNLVRRLEIENHP